VKTPKIRKIGLKGIDFLIIWWQC